MRLRCDSLGIECGILECQFIFVVPHVAALRCRSSVFVFGESFPVVVGSASCRPGTAEAAVSLEVSVAAALAAAVPPAAEPFFLPLK